MGNKTDEKRKYRATVHYIQEMPPRKMSHFTVTEFAGSPKAAMEGAIWRRREADPADRVYPEDVQVIVVVDMVNRSVDVFHRTLEITRDPRSETPERWGTAFVPFKWQPYRLRTKRSTSKRRPVDKDRL
ncbi:MAG: hypothetical protein KKG33_03145 [candidate division Zixibacteria bacterium]|nr:hypothetical protein [candidate division Zixibacteria bacterium]MBU1472076.1 hypothetical protein [candidate division Zixibacteria bacterium]MBU2624538.1 hypothetical protein [candidate division Zixibacteria bacterium]